MLAWPFDQLDQDQVTGTAETNPLPHVLLLSLASPPSLRFDYRLKIHNVTLILVKAQRRGEEHSWWKCLEWGNGDGWRTDLKLAIYGLCRSLAEAAL